MGLYWVRRRRGGESVEVVVGLLLAVAGFLIGFVALVGDAVHWRMSFLMSKVLWMFCLLVLKRRVMRGLE